MLIQGQIVGYDGETLSIEARCTNQYIMEKQGICDCEIRLNDGRTISNAQRRKIFALVSDIGSYVCAIKGDREHAEMLRQLKLLYVIDTTDNEAVRRQLTLNFCGLCDIDMFSLSDVDMTTARSFIDWLVEQCVVFDIPCNDTLLDRCEDVGRYLYLCVGKRRCAICGKKADIHEVETVGMGRNRRRIHHLGQRVQPLCRKHHSELGTIGQQTFNRKYHLQDIKLDEYLCKALGWRP